MTILGGIVVEASSTIVMYSLVGTSRFELILGAHLNDHKSSQRRIAFKRFQRHGSCPKLGWESGISTVRLTAISTQLSARMRSKTLKFTKPLCTRSTGKERTIETISHFYE